MSKLGKFAAACAAVVCVFTASASPLQQCELVVSGYAGTTELVDFPVLVRVSPTKVADFNYADCATGGADISFTDAEGNALPHEVDTWNPDGTSLVWVKLPTLSGKNTKLVMRWNDASPGENNPANVWSGYAGVWHLGEQTGDNYADSTGHGLTATNAVSATITDVCTTKAGKVGNGRWQPKLSLRIPSYDEQAVGGAFTASGWFYMDARTSYESFFNRKQVYDAGDGWQCNMQNSDKNVFVTGSGNKTSTSWNFGSSVKGRWVYVTLVYNDTKVSIYENGAKVGGDITIIAVKDNGRELVVGGSVKGTLDELRIRKSVASADWIKAQYDQVNSSSFVVSAVRKTYYVAKDGSDDNGGTSWDDALATVPAALAKFETPTVMVGEGRFDVSTAIKVTTGATICGSGNRGTVFRLNTAPADGDSTRAVFYVKHSDAVLTNLAMTTGGSARGRGLYLGGGTVTDCSITNCVTVNGTMNGGGVYLASGTLRNSYIYYNEANSSGGYGREGGGIYMTGGLVDRCIIRKNDACYTRGSSGSGKGGGIRMTSGTVRNCLFYDNFALSSGMALEISGGTVENCTIVRNGKTSIGYNAVNATGSPTIRNTIVRGNLSTTGSEANLSLATTVKLENVMSAGSSRSEIITSEPVFADAANGDWHILYCAAVDSGVDQTWMTTGLDLDGNARIVGKQVDLGCYEYVPSGLACGFDVTTDGALGESTVTLTGSVVGADEANVTFTWTLTDDRGNETTRAVVGSGTLELPMPIGAYAVRLAVSDGVNSAEAPERPNAFTVYAEHLYVSPEGSNEYPYGDFATAATNIEDIIAFATDGTTVHLSDGVHRLKDRLAINDGIVITHEGDPMDAVVTGGRTGTCLILLNHKNAVLSGLDICGSYPTKWRPGASAPTKAIHSGVRIMAGGTVTNCVIEGCYAKYSGGDSAQGGGIDMSAGRVVDCIIRNNREESSGGGGSYGGGVNVSGGTVDRCVITNNWASPGTGCIGGGVRITGGTLRNSLIAYCQTSGNGGGVFQTGGSVRNCTVVYNSATLGSGGISGTVTDCLKFGNDVNGMVEQGDDPGFRSAVTGDFHLSPGSAAIDASVTEGIGELDLDGNPRYQGKETPIADKGCYESDPNVFELGVDYVKLATFYPAEVAFAASAGGPALDEQASWWTFDGREPTADDYDAIGVCVTNTLPPAEYTVRFKTVFGGQTNEVVKEKWFVLNGETVYVNPKNANPAVPYATWATAAKDINAAFSYLIAGTTMVVSDGTYQVTTEQDLNRQVTVRSLNGPAVTAFTDSGVADHPFKINHSKALVTGFTFRDFDTWQYGGALPMYSGMVSNCVFRNCNMWNTGGGAVQMTGGTLVDCEVVSCYTKYNTDQSGSGVYASGSGCLIDRCYVHGCYFAADKPCYGAVALLNGAKMRNSVIASNTSAWSGGVLLTGSSVMENCTVIDNKASKANSAGGVAVGSDNLATVVNTIIWNNTNTTDHVRRETSGMAERFDTCWTEDPVFKSRGDKWQVRTKSPCMNAGKPLDWMDGATDIYGNPRVRYGTPDIGAVESPYDPGMMLIVR